MLVHHPEAGREVVARGVEVDGRSLDPDRSLVGAVEARQTLHERALAGAVLAEQGVDLRQPQVEVDPVVGEHARNRLTIPRISTASGDAASRGPRGPVAARRRRRVSVAGITGAHSELPRAPLNEAATQ